MSLGRRAERSGRAAEQIWSQLLPVEPRFPEGAGSAAASGGKVIYTDANSVIIARNNQAQKFGG
jgi:hypothetical protein